MPQIGLRFTVRDYLIFFKKRRISVVWFFHSQRLFIQFLEFAEFFTNYIKMHGDFFSFWIIFRLEKLNYPWKEIFIFFIHFLKTSIWDTCKYRVDKSSLLFFFFFLFFFFQQVGFTWLFIQTTCTIDGTRYRLFCMHWKHHCARIFLNKRLNVCWKHYTRRGKILKYRVIPWFTGIIPKILPLFRFFSIRIFETDKYS